MTVRARSELPVTVSALVERDGALLLVNERGPGDLAPTWMLPGGRVEAGETPDGALRREVTEETGLAVIGRPRLAFEVEIDARLEDLVGRWRAMTFACDATGDLSPSDPDELILAAEWVATPEALERLEGVEWYDSAPLRAFLSGSANASTSYRYDLTGRRGAVRRSIVEVVDDRTA